MNNDKEVMRLVKKLRTSCGDSILVYQITNLINRQRNEIDQKNSQLKKMQRMAGFNI